MGNMGKHSGTRPASTATAAAPVPGPAPEVEADRRRALRRHKAFVTGLLVVAAVIFLACSWWQSQPGGAPTWVGYVRAAAEACSAVTASTAAMYSAGVMPRPLRAAVE